MPESTHYTVLGVSETATGEEIRRAFRRLVLTYHPDRSGNTDTTDAFVKVTEAYQALSDKQRRGEYDTILRYRRERLTTKAAPPRQEPRPTQQQTSTRQTATSPEQVSARLSQAIKYFSKGRYDLAEEAANRVIAMNPSSATAHAILGDIARNRFDFEEALKRYSFALQYEPNNAQFLRNYEDMIRRTTKPTGKRGHVSAKEPAPTPAVIALFVSVALMFYVGASHESPVAPQLALINTWSFGLIAILFLNGVLCGIALSASLLIDTWASSVRPSSGTSSRLVAYFVLALLNFWAAALYYVFNGTFRHGFSYTMSRFLGAVGALTVAYSLMAVTSSSLSPIQTLLWGGNVICLGAIAGWAVSDAFR